MIEENMWVVDHVIKDYRHLMQYNDLKSAGLYGLIQGIDKYVNSWYNLRSGSDGGMYATHDIYGQPTFGAWKQSITGNIILDQEEDKKSSNDIVGDTMKFLTE